MTLKHPGLNLDHFRADVIQPTLAHLDGDDAPRFQGLAAENLLLGTALVESGLHYLHQLGGGPALGIYQIETH